MDENSSNRSRRNYQDFEGRTVEEAIESALTELKFTSDKIKIRILSEGQRGLFGMEGVKKAKIRVTIPSEDTKTT